MRERIAKLGELSCVPLALFFLTLVLLRELNILSLPIDYLLLGILVALAAIATLLVSQPETETTKGILPILVAAFLVAFASRVLPYTRSPVPLGYDPGFYKYVMDLYASALPQLPEASLATWVKEMYPQGLFVLLDALHLLTGIDTMLLVNYLLLFLGALLVLPVFVVTRSLFGQRAGLVACVLYSISYTQYTAFTLFYLKNVFGLMFLLFSIYALEKRRFGLMAVMFAALGIFHRPEFLIFALILIPYFILHRQKGVILAVLGTAVIIAPFWLPRWEVNWAMLSRVMEAAVANVQTGTQLGGGTFFDFVRYKAVSLTYLPFAVVGAYIVARSRWNSVLLYLLVNLIVVAFQLFFFRRLIITLDLALIMLAAVGICHIFLWKSRWKAVGVTIAAALLVMGAGVPMVNEARTAQPLVSEQQMEVVKWLAKNAEQDAYVLTTSYDAPWVLGWSGRKVIAPGLFEWNVHGEKEWLSFLQTKDSAEAEQFLGAYDGPIYIYYSQNSGNYLRMEKFENDRFQQLSEGAAVVYKYLGRK